MADELTHIVLAAGINNQRLLPLQSLPPGGGKNSPRLVQAHSAVALDADDA